MTGLSLAAEKRCSLRNAINQPVRLELTTLVQGKIRSAQINGICLDISSEGIGVSTTDPLRKGDVLKLHLSVSDMKVTLPILTEVKWLRRVDDQYKAGLQFLA